MMRSPLLGPSETCHRKTRTQAPTRVQTTTGGRLTGLSSERGSMFCSSDFVSAATRDSLVPITWIGGVEFPNQSPPFPHAGGLIIALILASGLGADFRQGQVQLLAHRECRHLDLAGALQIEHETESFGHARTGRQEPMIAKDHRFHRAKVARQPFPFAKVEGFPLV